MPGFEAQCLLNGNLPLNGNVAKRSASFFEAYGKVNITLNDQWQVGFNEYYSPNFLNLGAWGDYASITGKWTAPSTTFGTSGVGMYISGEFGRLWLGTSDSFYGVNSPLANFSAGIPEPSYNTWNIGVGFTYKVFTLDLRYSDTNLSKSACNAFTSDYTTTNFNANFVTAINPGGFGSKLVRCGRYRQALGRPDGDDQPQVTLLPRLNGAAERSAALFVCRDFRAASGGFGQGLAAAITIPQRESIATRHQDDMARMQGFERRAMADRDDGGIGQFLLEQAV